jgi:uncharacterized damage-inducible protein DinB
MGKLMIGLLVIAFVLTPAVATMAQDKPAEDKSASAPSPANPMSTFTKMVYGRLKDILLRSAEKVPEQDYSFKPTAAVRSYGQIIGHLADAQYIFCSRALGEKGPDLKIEQTKTAKADLIASLKQAFTYCDKAYDGMTDAAGVEPIKLFGMDAPKLGALTVNNMHNMEHYGNLVTYMRLKNIVPPTSEQAPQASPQQSNQQPPKK